MLNKTEDELRGQVPPEIIENEEFIDIREVNTLILEKRIKYR